MILLIDNYDSFTYNIVHYLAEINQQCEVIRNDKINLAKINNKNYKAIFISPGPSEPKDAGQSLEIIKKFYQTMPIFGVCLGHQAIAEAFGAKIIKAKIPMHGKTSEIFHDGKGCFDKLPSPFLATRYHSLVIDKNTLSDEFEISATTYDQNEIMGIRHKNFPLESVQFHPESIASKYGHQIFQNFLDNINNHY